MSHTKFLKHAHYTAFIWRYAIPLVASCLLLFLLYRAISNTNLFRV